jgi:hypothetical protein
MRLRPLALAAAMLAAVLAPAAEAGKGRDRATPRLLLHDWFGNSPAASPSFVRDHQEFLESQPFDGLALYLRTPDLGLNVTAGILSERRFTAEEIEGVLRPVASLDFRRLTHNFAAVLGGKPPDVFDDWSGVVGNFGRLAKAARGARLEGVYFDNENYGAHWTDYPSGVAYPKKPLAEYEAQARLRGRQVMEAMTAEFPDVVVILLHGPYLSEPKAPQPLFPPWAAANRLMGPFFAGFVEGAGDRATVVDGGELYNLRTEEDFKKSYDWRKTELPSDRVDCPFLPPGVRARWARTVEVGFGVYDRPVGASSMDPPTLRSVVERALLRTDRYVWLYVEGPTFLRPPKKEGAPEEWVTAVREGRDAALRSRHP